jgi:hypothetical protein
MMNMMNGIKEIAESIGSELQRRLPKQRKTQGFVSFRGKLRSRQASDYH